MARTVVCEGAKAPYTIDVKIIARGHHEKLWAIPLLLSPLLNAVRRSSLRAQPALHKPPQGGFFTTAQAFFTASISKPHH